MEYNLHNAMYMTCTLVHFCVFVCMHACMCVYMHVSGGEGMTCVRVCVCGYVDNHVSGANDTLPDLAASWQSCWHRFETHLDFHFVVQVPFL